LVGKLYSNPKGFLFSLRKLHRDRIDETTEQGARINALFYQFVGEFSFELGAKEGY
jgi:hypothetical protein